MYSMNINVIKAQTDRLLHAKRIADCESFRPQDLLIVADNEHLETSAWDRLSEQTN
jgi:hypothetical protein